MSRAGALPAGAGAGPVGERTSSRRGAWAVAATPLLAALAALFAVFLTGFDQRSAMPPDVAARFYGFFLDRYPLFAFALVYGLVRILAAMLAPGPASVVRRLIGGGIGLALVLAVSLHPTFGGLVLRAGFGTGSGAFLNGTPMAIAYTMGAGAAAGLFGLATGLGARLAGRPGPALGGSRWRRAGWALRGWIAGFLALWFAAAVIGLARDAGFGPWPRRPLDARDLVVAAGLLTLAALPHVLLVAARRRPSRRPG
ncbi:hypothetical protein HNR01_005296 [Methylorubrum rhodesianum]|uniref:hypothetical protein n=1 Tax=Methylorubrum TaxID=2282523 RepID=UPI00160FCF07|nr:MULTISPECIES: hypothetical protein [Methylorubrum]MBB5765637.1 hypothetical protein [Methylorubrum rhodesianum]MBI1691855.1 hypothetical protein [Methylorubrum sp. DB1722]